MDLHNCKRLLTYKEINNNQIKTLFKKIYVIMKSILIINDYTPKNYKEFENALLKQCQKIEIENNNVRENEEEIE